MKRSEAVKILANCIVNNTHLTNPSRLAEVYLLELERNGLRPPVYKSENSYDIRNSPDELFIETENGSYCFVENEWEPEE